MSSVESHDSEASSCCSRVRDVSRRRAAVKLAQLSSSSASLKHIWKNKAITTSTRLRLLRSLVCPVGTYGAEAWTFGKWEQQRLLSFETICYRRVMRVPWTEKRRNDDILEEVCGIKLWNSVVAIMRKEDDSLEKCIIMGMVEGIRGRGRPRRAWSDDFEEWTNLSTEEMLQLTKDRSAWRSLVYCVANVRVSEWGTNDDDDDNRIHFTAINGWDRSLWESNFSLWSNGVHYLNHWPVACCVILGNYLMWLLKQKNDDLSHIPYLWCGLWL